MKLLKVKILFPVVVGIVLGSVMLYLGILHNTQGEFISEGKIDLLYCLGVFFIWFVAGSVGGGILIGLYQVLVKMFRNLG